MCGDSSSVFNYMYTKGIGHQLSLFYEAYALVLELKGDFSKADLVYTEGVQR